MRLKLTDIPEEVIKEYNLTELATPDGWVYIEISRGMYGLPQAGIIAQEQLEENRHQEFLPGYANEKKRIYEAKIG